jgi:hypothetical protein
MAVPERLPVPHIIRSRQQQLPQLLTEAVADVAINWGVLEGWMFRLMDAIDPDRRDQWMAEFLAPRISKVRADRTLKRVREAVDGTNIPGDF